VQRKKASQSGRPAERSSYSVYGNTAPRTGASASTGRDGAFLPSPVQLLSLQRSAGNAAVAGLVRRWAGEPVLSIQRSCNVTAGAGPIKNKARIEKNEGVIQHFRALWEQSQPHAMNVSPSKLLPMATIQSAKHEYGCWIIRNRLTKNLRWVDWPVGRRDESTPSAPALNLVETVIGEFHTHPNTGEEGYDKGPSPADLGAKNPNHVGICRSQIGGYHWY
jgi:hypothetical protein